METIELLTCTQCRGKGYYGVDGFDGRERVNCEDCTGTGTIEFVVTDWDAYEIEVLGMTAEAYNAIAAVEEFLGVAGAVPVATPMPMPVHPNMSVTFFDNAVCRAFNAELCIQATNRASVVAVSSASDADVSYLVTRETCQCSGHRSVGRCYHRALACWHWWVLECDAVALAALPVPVEDLIAA